MRSFVECKPKQNDKTYFRIYYVIILFEFGNMLSYNTIYTSESKKFCVYINRFPGIFRIYWYYNVPHAFGHAAETKFPKFLIAERLSVMLNI